MGLNAMEDEARGARRLKGNVVGPLGLAALAIGVMSPAIGLYACWGPIEAAAGPIAPLVFLAALAITLPTVLSYAALNRHAPSAGAAAAWLWTTVNPTTGLVAGLVTISYFTMGALTTPLLFGLFFRDLMEWAGAPLRGMAAVAIGVVLHSAIVAWISVRGAEASIKTTIRLMLIETGVVLALSATILMVKAGQPGGIHLGPFDPGRAAHGAGGFWAAVLLGMLAFTGFDVVAATAEEAKAPRAHVPRVLVLAVVGIALFWAANAWVLTLSTPPAKVADYNAQGLTAITSVARAYWGGGELIVIATGFTGLTAIYIGCVQGASRVIFALARHGLAPAPFARLEGARRVPRAAVLAVVGACAALALASLAVLGNGLDAFVWWSNAVVFFAAITFIGVNVANLIYFRRVAPEHFNVWLNLVAPVVGIGLSLYLIYAAFFSALWSQPFRTGRSVVIACLGLFALQLLIAAGTRLMRRHLFTAAGPIGVPQGASEAA
ncbi:MAG: Amino acid transporter [Caulobacteraceae bacterium]|nr:Amino acid transporter [Caulobacteraceae bacterium]